MDHVRIILDWTVCPAGVGELVNMENPPPHTHTGSQKRVEQWRKTSLNKGKDFAFHRFQFLLGSSLAVYLRVVYSISISLGFFTWTVGTIIPLLTGVRKV